MGIFKKSNSKNAEKDQGTAGEVTFESIFKEYFPRLNHFAYQIVKDKETAEDLAQSAFLTYWNQREEVSDNIIAIKNFLYTTVRNTCLNNIRHSKVVHHYLGQQEANPIDDASVVRSMIESEVLSQIYAAIESLPPSCQRITRLGYLEGLKNSEIAQEVGVSINTVKTQKQRGIQLLRLKLNPEMLIHLFLGFFYNIASPFVPLL